MERIEAELLIPGEGEPVSDGVVIIADSAISYAGPASQAPATPGAVLRRTETVKPGMWDCHGHFSAYARSTLAGFFSTRRRCGRRARVGLWRSGR